MQEINHRFVKRVVPKFVYHPFLSTRIKESGYLFTYFFAISTVESFDPSFTIITSILSISSGQDKEDRVSSRNFSTL